MSRIKQKLLNALNNFRIPKVLKLHRICLACIELMEEQIAFILQFLVLTRNRNSRAETDIS